MKLISLLSIFSLTLILSMFNVNAAEKASPSGGKEANSLLRITCSGDDIGAEVQINGKFRGECPVDISISEGTYKLRVFKKVDDTHEGAFEQDVRVGAGNIKKVEAILTTHLNAIGQKREDERLAVERAEAIKREQERLRVEAVKRVELDAALTTLRQQGAEVGNGKPFHDCPDCPEMVLVSSPGKDPVAIGRFEITRGQFATYINETKESVPGCNVYKDNFLRGGNWEKDAQKNWMNPGFDQTNNHPVVCVSWSDADRYIKWLSKKTGQEYSLLTYDWWSVAAGGVYGEGVPPYENNVICSYANVRDQSAVRADGHDIGYYYGCDDKFTYTAPVGSFKPTTWGVYDIQGNASEWLKDVTGGAITHPRYVPDSKYMTRGFSWLSGGSPMYFSSRIESDSRLDITGFRVMRTLSK